MEGIHISRTGSVRISVVASAGHQRHISGVIPLRTACSGIVKVCRTEKVPQLMRQRAEGQIRIRADSLADSDKAGRAALLHHHAIHLASRAAGVMRVNGKLIAATAAVTGGILITAADIDDGKLGVINDTVAVFVKSRIIHIGIRRFQRRNAGSIILRARAARLALRMRMRNGHSDNTVVRLSPRFRRRIKIKCVAGHFLIIRFERLAAVSEAQTIPIRIGRVCPLLA